MLKWVFHKLVIFLLWLAACWAHKWDSHCKPFSRLITRKNFKCNCAWWICDTRVHRALRQGCCWMTLPAVPLTELTFLGHFCRSIWMAAWGSLSFVRFPDHGFMKHLFIFMQLLCLNHVTLLACLYCSPQHVKGVDLITEMKNYPDLQFYLALKITALVFFKVKLIICWQVWERHSCNSSFSWK